MRKTKRLLSVAAVAATAMSLAACANSEEDSPGGGGQGASGAAPSAPSSDAGSAAGGDSAAMGDGKTTEKDVFGDGCAQVPKSGTGSLGDMIQDPVGTAAGSNPLLKTATQAIEAADLGPTLDKQDAEYTVFAPADPAFDKIPPEQLQGLLKQKQQLRDLLTYHVLDQRMDKDGLQGMKEFTPVGGGGAKLTVGGSGDRMTVTDGAGNTANVLCGNVPTANATVFVIDSVLMPAAS